MLKHGFIRSASISVVTLVAIVVPVISSATNSWGGYHWARTTHQFTLKTGDNLTTSDWKAQLAQASRDWNSPSLFGAASTPLLTAVVAGNNKQCSMILGTTQVCNGSYGTNGWLGLASINITGDGHIAQGTAKMNDTYFATATYNSPNERRHVMCQEVAHTFGLDHQSTDGSSLNTCMDYFSNTGANAGSTLSITPNKHDFDELNLVYAHLDGTTTVASTTARAASASDVTDDPASWGNLISQSPYGRSSTYEKFNRDGSKTLTHVYWTIEAASRCASCDHRYEDHHLDR